MEPNYDLSEWMTAQEVADWLKMTPRKLASNRIPCAMVGDVRVYHKGTVGRWLENRMKRDYRLDPGRS